MRLTPAQAQRAFIPLIALTMSGVMSLFMTAVNAGVGWHLLAAWPQQWATGFVVALPTALAIVPRIRAGLARITVEPTIARTADTKLSGAPTYRSAAWKP